MKAEILNQSDARWSEVLARARHDFYHLPGYSEHEAAAMGDGAQACTVLVSNGENACLLPLLRIPLHLDFGDPGLFDARSPYGYPGPIFTTENPQFQSDALAAATSILAEQNVVSLFLRLHPLLNSALAIPEDVGVLVTHGETVWLNLQLSEEQMWKLTRNNHRRGIKDLLKNGATVEVDHDWTSFPEFHACYTETMKRVEASSFYFFPPEYFWKLKILLNDRLHLCIVRIDGKVACGGVFSKIGSLMEYHLAGTADAFLDQHPSKLMFHFMRNWGRTQGADCLNLGGGVGGKADSLFLFKQGFSDWTLPFRSARIIVNKPQFEKLTNQWATKAGMPVETSSDFFPPYRKKISPAQ